MQFGILANSKTLGMPSMSHGRDALPIGIESSSRVGTPHPRVFQFSTPGTQQCSTTAMGLRLFADPPLLVVLHQAGTSVGCECTELGQVCSSKQQSVAILSMQLACPNAGKDRQSPGSKLPFCFIPLTANLPR